MSQIQLAARSGVSQQAISKLEAGKSSPSEYTIRQLADALHVQPSVLLDENAQKNTAAIRDGVRNDIIAKIDNLSPQALARLSDYLDGLVDGSQSTAPSPTAPNSNDQGA